jgi:hypothetical protein
MSENSARKNAKYFVFSNKPGLQLPPYRHPLDPKIAKGVTYVDNETVPGADFYCESTWLLPGQDLKTKFGKKPNKPLNTAEPHSHGWGEFIGFFGFNFDNITDLGAEVEFWIDGEKFMLTKSFTAFIPPGLTHCPLIVRNIVRPIMVITAGQTQLYR